MRTLRKYSSWLFVLIATLALTWIYAVWGRDHHRWAFPSGWLLLGIMVFLTLYNARKKLPGLRLGSSRLWLNLHIYLGLFSVVVFLFHLRFRWPTGWFEVVLAALFAIVAVSGIVGWILSRDYPKRLTIQGGDVLYERIPVVRRRLAEQAEEVALGSVAGAGSATLADFYAAELHGYFARHHHFFQHCLAREGAVAGIRQRMQEQDRFLNDAEREEMQKLIKLVSEKHALDFQYSLQTALRMWLFVHIPFTYSLLLWSAAHVLLVYGFSASAGTVPTGGAGL